VVPNQVLGIAELQGKLTGPFEARQDKTLFIIGAPTVRMRKK
jgi:hypothetical protein